MPRRLRRIYVRAQTDPQSAQLWWPGLGVARLASPVGTYKGTDGRTDGASLNATPYGGGIITGFQSSVKTYSGGGVVDGDGHGVPRSSPAQEKLRSPNLVRTRG